MPPILGLSKAIDDPGTGAVSHFHVVVAYMVMLRGDTSSVTFGSWASRDAYEAQKRPMAHITVPVKGRPAGDSEAFPQWFYERVLALEVANHLTGAEAVVTSDSAEPAEEHTP